ELEGEAAKAKADFNVEYVQARDPSYYGYGEFGQAPHGVDPQVESDFWTSITLVGHFLASLVPAVVSAVAIGALLASCSPILVVAGWAVVIYFTASTLYGAYDSTMTRMQDGQDIGSAIAGGIADVTPIQATWRGVTGTDFSTGRDLHMS